MRAGSHRRPGSRPQASSRIAVVGSCNLDIVTYTDRIPAPGETVIGRRRLQVRGGKGANLVVAAAGAGAEVSFIGAVGEGGFGELLATALRREGVITAALRPVSMPTGTAHITIDSAGENAIVTIAGANAGVSLNERDRAVIASTQALLLQLEIPLEIVVAAAAVAHGAGAHVILTPAPGPSLPAELSRFVDLLIPNESEAVALTGASSGDQAADLLLAEVPAVAVTLGARGCIYRERGGPSPPLPAFPAPSRLWTRPPPAIHSRVLWPSRLPKVAPWKPPFAGQWRRRRSLFSGKGPSRRFPTGRRSTASRAPASRRALSIKGSPRRTASSSVAPLPPRDITRRARFRRIPITGLPTRAHQGLPPLEPRAASMGPSHRRAIVGSESPPPWEISGASRHRPDDRGGRGPEDGLRDPQARAPGD